MQSNQRHATPMQVGGKPVFCTFAKGNVGGGSEQAFRAPGHISHQVGSKISILSLQQSFVASPPNGLTEGSSLAAKTARPMSVRSRDLHPSEKVPRVVKGFHDLRTMVNTFNNPDMDASTLQKKNDQKCTELLGYGFP